MHKFGFDVLAIVGQCQIGMGESFEYDDIATEEDLYDPSKPEFIAPATHEEVAETNAALLAKQIAKLEAHAARRRAESKVATHYHNVVSTLRSKEAALGGKLKSQFLNRRVRSQPDLVQLEEFSPRCRSSSDALAAVPEEVPVACEELATLSVDDEPAANVVRSCPTWLNKSMAELNCDLYL